MALGTKWSMKAEDLWPVLMDIATNPEAHSLIVEQKEAMDITTDIMMKNYKYLMPDKKEKRKSIPDQIYT